MASGVPGPAQPASQLLAGAGRFQGARDVLDFGDCLADPCIDATYLLQKAQQRVEAAPEVLGQQAGLGRPHLGFDLGHFVLERGHLAMRVEAHPEPGNRLVLSRL